MVDAQLAATQAAIEAAIKSGALIHHRVALEEGEWEQRSLWLRPEVNDLVSTKKLDPDQRERVKAALRRFVIGGPFTVVKAGSPHGEASNLGDIKELQGPPPPLWSCASSHPSTSCESLAGSSGRMALF